MSTMTIIGETIVAQAEGNLVSDMNGEKVMMSIGTGKYYNLGEIGGRIWELIAGPVEVDRLVDLLMSEYEIDAETCRSQVVSFLEKLRSEKLIVVGTGGRTAPLKAI